MENPLTVTINLTKEDVVALMYHHTLQKKATRLLLVLLVVAIVLNVIANLLLKDPSFYTVTFLLLGLILFVAFFPILLRKVAIREFESNKRLQESITYIFSQEEMEGKGESFTNKFSWDKLYKITQNKKYFYLWQSQNLAVVLPKKELTSEVVTLIEQKKNKK